MDNRIEQLYRALVESEQKNESLTRKFVNLREEFDQQQTHLKNLNYQVQRQQQTEDQQQKLVFQYKSQLEALQQQLSQHGELRDLVEKQNKAISERDALIAKLDTTENISKSEFDKLKSDYEKLKSRQQAELNKTVERVKEESVLPILNLFDSFKIAMAAINDPNGLSSIDQGLGIIDIEFSRLLTEMGIKTINAVNHKFDPELHEAVSHEESSVVPEGYVVRQWRCGYQLNDKLIRPATVVVSRSKDEA